MSSSREYRRTAGTRHCCVYAFSLRRSSMAEVTIRTMVPGIGDFGDRYFGTDR
jgi:uracil phosphoribosyltransferase